MKVWGVPPVRSTLMTKTVRPTAPRCLRLTARDTIGGLTAHSGPNPGQAPLWPVHMPPPSTRPRQFSRQLESNTRNCKTARLCSWSWFKCSKVWSKPNQFVLLDYNAASFFLVREHGAIEQQNVQGRIYFKAPTGCLLDFFLMFTDVVAYFPDYCHNEIQCCNISSATTVFICRRYSLPTCHNTVSAALSSQQVNAVDLQYLIQGILKALENIEQEIWKCRKSRHVGTSEK